MLSVQGYYDGMTVRPLETIVARPNQKVIITIMDEFVEPEELEAKQGMRGVLAQFADSALVEKEEGAWERAASEKHCDI